MKLYTWLADKLIAHAIHHPYYHLKHADGDAHMDRFWVVKPRAWLPLSVRVHHILSSDRGRCIHDHTQSSLSLILRDGCWEITPGDASWRGEGDWVLRAAGDQYRLLVSKKTSCWYFVIMFGKVWAHNEARLSGIAQAGAKEAYA